MGGARRLWPGAGCTAWCTDIEVPPTCAAPMDMTLTLTLTLALALNPNPNLRRADGHEELEASLRHTLTQPAHAGAIVSRDVVSRASYKGG